jgi:pimeloyl-ACP methyl ester carboxylesterase
LNSLVLGKPENPCILLLHGWGHSLDSLYPIGELLSQDYQVHLIDFPGFGRSVLPDEAKTKEGAWDTYNYAEVIAGYLERNNIRKTHILGHSFGGRVCLQLSCHFGEYIDRIILLDAAGLKPIRSGKAKRRMFRIKLIRKWMDIAGTFQSEAGRQQARECFSERYGSRDYKNAGDLRNVLVKTVTEDQTENARQVKHKTLVLWGEDDPETPVYMAKLLHEYIRDSRMVLMQHKGHEPFRGLGAHLCTYHILKFLRDQ